MTEELYPFQNQSYNFDYKFDGKDWKLVAVVTQSRSTDGIEWEEAEESVVVYDPSREKGFVVAWMAIAGIVDDLKGNLFNKEE